MPSLPNIAVTPYNQTLNGVYGEFGSGAGLRAFYLQTAITPAELGRISLISDIPGSERWEVRDLFQREVDNERISTSLLPYLQNEDKIKFFNPLTLTVLPMNDDGTSVLATMPRVVDKSEADDGTTWSILEREEYYQLRWVSHHPEWAQLKWNDRRSRLVAIDGQHRLSALKRFRRNKAAGKAREEFMRWRIPAVIVTFRAVEGESEPPSVLDVVRSIFVYINTRAQKVNDARAILLSDESINSICTQELLQHSHDNDIGAAEQRSETRIPLLFYDWRGEERDQKRVKAPAAMKTVEEIHNWFVWHIFGEDFLTWQETALGINPTNPLKRVFLSRQLTYGDAEKIRDRFNEHVRPAISHLFENFKPYRSYIAGLRALERKYYGGDQGDLAAHAFEKLRFGTSQAPGTLQGEVEKVIGTINRDIDDLKRACFDDLLRHDIGMRGIIHAFGDLPQWFDYPDWLEFAEWFTTSINNVYEDKWLDTRARPRSRYRKFLRHVTEDHGDEVVNYRLGQVGDGLGAHVMLLVATYGRPWRKAWGDEWVSLKEHCLDRLRSTIEKGYRREVKPALREKYPNEGKELRDAVNVEAAKRARAQILELEKVLKKVE